MLICMLAVFAVVLTLQDQPCTMARAILASAELREVQDVSEAVQRLQVAEVRSCDELGVAVAYLDGLIAAEAAWRAGGSPESLVPIRLRMAELSLYADRGSSAAAIARLVLGAQIAAAQNEAAEMALLLDQAVELEANDRVARRPVLAVVSALEAAGDCWLRLFRFPEAVAAYERARAVSPNNRVERALRRAQNGVRGRTPQ